MSWWQRRRSKLSSPSPTVEKDRIDPPNLFDVQLSILGGRDVSTIIDATAMHGWQIEEYLRKFAQSRVIAIGPSRENIAKAVTRLAPLKDRVELIRATLGASLDAVDQSDIDGYNDPLDQSAPGILASDKIDVLTVDHICTERAIDVVDIFRMEIRDGSFRALKGAEKMLVRGAIRLLMVRVGFARRQGDMPTLGDVTEYLRRFGYELQGIHGAHRDPPIVLRDAEAIFVAPQLQPRPEIPSSPTIPNETIESVNGHRLPDRFLGKGELREGATVRAQALRAQPKPQSEQTPQHPIEVASILNVVIETSDLPYRYSLVIDTDSEIARKFNEGDLVVVEVALTVYSGKVGIVWIDRNYKPLEARERYLPAISGVQRVLVEAPAEQASHLVLRNVASDSARSTFKVSRIKAKIVGNSFRRVLSDSGAEALYLHAYTRERAGDRESAARLFADAAALVPGHSVALEGQGELFDMAGDRTAATEKYDAVRRARAQNQERAPDRCFVLRRRGPFTDQIAAYNSLLHSMKYATFPYVARGNAFLSDGHADAALRDYQSALELKPGLSEVLVLKGEALNMLGCYGEALETFDSAAAQRSEDPELLSGRAIAHLAMGKLEAADTDWRRQLALLAPAQASARACVALRLADYETAVVELERALLKEPHDPYWRLYHMTALRRLGRPAPTFDLKDAKGWPSLLLALHAGRLSGNSVLKKADNDSRRAEALFQLGVLALPHDREEAMRRWTEVLERSGPDMIEHAAARQELVRLQS